MIKNRLPPLTALLAGLLLSAPAPAQTFTVDTTEDTPDQAAGDGRCADAEGRCSLRAAVQESNATFNPEPSGSVIELPAGRYRITLEGADEELAASGDLDILQPIAIRGVDARDTIIDGNYLDRVFEVRSTLTLSALAIVHGHTGGDGGAVLVNGGQLSTEAVMLWLNGARRGGGVAVLSGGRVNINRSEIADNTAGEGGGIYSDNAFGVGTGEPLVMLLNTTVAVNGAERRGGGIVNHSRMALVNVTLADNAAFGLEGTGRPYGGGLLNSESGTLELVNTLVARNTAVGPVSDNCLNSGRILDDHSLEDADSCGFLGPGSMVNAAAGLGLNNWNGGGTRTYAITPESPAADAGNPERCPQVDQRGIARSDCDIGAFEAQAAPPPVDLAVSVNAAPAEIRVGEPVIIDLTVTNHRNLALFPNLTVELPAQLQYEQPRIPIFDPSAPLRCVNTSGNHCDCALPTLGAGESVRVRVDATGKSAGSGSVIAVVAAQSEPEADPTNNSDTTEVRTTEVVNAGGGGGALSPWSLICSLPLLALARRRRG